jgi:hypothetical protein
MSHPEDSSHIKSIQDLVHECILDHRDEFYGRFVMNLSPSLMPRIYLHISPLTAYSKKTYQLYLLAESLPCSSSNIKIWSGFQMPDPMETLQSLFLEIKDEPHHSFAIADPYSITCFRYFSRRLSILMDDESYDRLFLPIEERFKLLQHVSSLKNETFHTQKNKRKAL